MNRFTAKYMKFFRLDAAGVYDPGSVTPTPLQITVKLVKISVLGEKNQVPE
jgi:hypothetical protein